MKGEFEKRVKVDSFSTTWHSANMTYQKDSILLDNLEKIIDEAQGEFPTRREFLEVMKYIELGFSDDKPYKQFLLKTVKQAKDGCDKWFGER